MIPDPLNFQEIQEVKEKAQMFDFKKISQQIKELIENLSRRQKVNREKYSQISHEAFNFLTSEGFKRIPQKERETMLFYLLTAPKIEEQKRIVNFIENLFDKSIDLKEQRAELIKGLIIEDAFERMMQSKDFRSLLFFYRTPENRNFHPEIFREVFNTFLESLERENDYSSYVLEELIYFYLNPENQRIDPKYPDINHPEILKKVLKRAVEDERLQFFLLDFYKDPANQHINPEYLLRILDIAHSDYEFGFGPLIGFYSNPENQKIRPDIFNDLFKEIKRKIDKHLFSLLRFYQNPENQKINPAYPEIDHPKILNEVLEKSFKNRSWDALLSFFENSENQKRYSQMFEAVIYEVLKEARKDNEEPEKTSFWFLLFNFYKNPENQKNQPEIFKETLDKVSQILTKDLENEGQWEIWKIRNLVEFFKNPDNQRLYFDVFKVLLEKLRRQDFFFAASSLIYLFSDPKTRAQFQSETMIEIRDKIIRSRKLISDQNLRPFFDSEIFKYLSEDNPLSLIAFSSNKDLSLLILGKVLGIDPFVIQTWGLSKEEKDTLLSTFFSLLNKGIRIEFPFPYYPRPELKFTKKHNEMLIEYFKNLDFLSSLPQNIFGDIVSAHFEKIKEIIQKYNVRQTALQEISFSFLKEILSEIRMVQKEVYLKLKKLIPFQEEIDPQKLLGFLKESGISHVIFALSSHYSKINYQEGLNLLGKIILAMIKNCYFQTKYDLGDPITREQLAPLLKDKKKREYQEKYQEIIEKWKKNDFVFKVLVPEVKEKRKFSEPDREQVLRHLKAQIYDNEYYKHLFYLKEFSNIDEESKKKISEFFDIIFTFNKKTLNLKELRNILEKLNLDKSKIKILTGYLQLLRDASIPKKSFSEILSTLEKLKENIEQHWQEFGSLNMWNEDFYQYLNQVLRVENKKTEKKITIFLSYFTDHPKTLFEIGKYPVPTCQSYESAGFLNKKLLGYIFDAHIKTLFLREVIIEEIEDIDEETLNELEVKINEAKEENEIKTLQGRVLKGKISKPIARRIVMLGTKNEIPTLVVEPLYSIEGRDESTFRIMIDSLLTRIRKEFNLEITFSSSEVKLPPSHNPEGYYLDQ